MMSYTVKYSFFLFHNWNNSYLFSFSLILSDIDGFIYMNSDYNLMGLFSKFRKKKEDSEELGGKATDINDKQQKNSEKEPVSN